MATLVRDTANSSCELKIELERFSSNEHSSNLPAPRLVSENQATGPKPCPPGEPGARRSDPIVRSRDPRAGSTARARYSNSAPGAAFMSPLLSVPSFSLDRKWLPFSPLMVVFDPGVFGAHCLGCFSVCTFRGSGALCRPLPSGPPPLAPAPAHAWRANLRSGPGASQWRPRGAPPEPAPTPRRAPLPAPSSRRGAQRDDRGADVKSGSVETRIPSSTFVVPCMYPSSTENE
ncbi:uncharacterized protein LOC125084393 [Lutra lutra]|uniref:uncharacterized protein LOC125084393 n=1 Tax=Lutra lutra TaxID=9657 RepID=UPI001FD59DC2|nr:uncharacterized protein LOC125084393 [Lutra lutra]